MKAVGHDCAHACVKKHVPFALIYISYRPPLRMH